MEKWKLIFFLLFQCFSIFQGCDEVPVVENADRMVESDFSGTRVTYKCRNGILIGSSVLFCNASRQWDAPPPLCKEQKCTTESVCPLLDLHNGEVTSGLKMQYFPGDKVTFQCYPGFLLVGSQTIICSQAETWIPDPPKCIKKEFTYCGVEMQAWKSALEQEKLCLEQQKAELERTIKAI